jgi:hypothetical protein
VILIVAVVAFTLLRSSGGSSGDLHTTGDQVAKQLLVGLKDTSGRPLINVQCPDEQLVVGEHLNCTFTFANKSYINQPVTVQEQSGHVKLKVGFGDLRQPAPTTTTAHPVPATLGQPHGPNEQGYGDVEPSTIFNGGDETGLVTGITWHHWGSAMAIGTGGTSDYVGAGSTVAGGSPELATVVAFDLGTCHGRAGYLAVEWYFPEEGQTFSPHSYLNDCTGDYVTPATVPTGTTPAASGASALGGAIITQPPSSTSDQFSGYLAEALQSGSFPGSAVISDAVVTCPNLVSLTAGTGFACNVSSVTLGDAQIVGEIEVTGGGSARVLVGENGFGCTDLTSQEQTALVALGGPGCKGT